MATHPPTLAPTRTRVREVIGALVLTVFMLAGTFGEAAHRHLGGARHPDGWVVLLLVAMGAALTARRRHPVAVLGAVWGLTFVYLLAYYPDGPVWLALLVAYFTAVARGHRLAAGIAGVSGFIVFSELAPLLGRGPGPGFLVLFALAAWLLVVFAVGEGARIRRQRLADAAVKAAEEEARTASEERLRIARDLHDVLAHNISLITVQAGVALHLNEDLPEQAASALRAIRSASQEALLELRSALDALRQNGDGTPRAPAPGLGSLADLLAGARSAGLSVTVEQEGEPAGLAVPVDLAAYRVIQEALTNVIRHAGASQVWIRISYRSDELAVRIEDDGRGAPAGTTPGGSGLVGMRERVEGLGGSLATGPRPGRGFQVLARLPLTRAEAPGGAVVGP